MKYIIPHMLNPNSSLLWSKELPVKPEHTIPQKGLRKVLMM